MSQNINLPCASSQPTAIPNTPSISISGEALIIEENCNVGLLNDLALFQFSSDAPSDALSKFLNREKDDKNKIVDPDDVYNYALENQTIIDATYDDFEKKKLEYEYNEQQLYVKYILEEIDKKYSSGFKDNTLQIHAQLSYSKFWNAGLNILNFFTNDDIDTVWIGNSSSDLRSHSIIKDRKRNMVFEYHNAYGKLDIFPLTGIMGYLEAYDPEIVYNEQWINLNMTLPAYDMQPLDKLKKDESS